MVILCLWVQHPCEAGKCEADGVHTLQHRTSVPLTNEKHHGAKSEPRDGLRMEEARSLRILPSLSVLTLFTGDTHWTAFIRFPPLPPPAASLEGFPHSLAM